MTTQITPISSEKFKSVPQTSWMHRLPAFIILLVCGIAVIILGSNYFDILPTNKNLTYNLIVSAACLVATLWLRGNARLNRFWRIAFTFFVASAAYPITLLFSSWSYIVLGWFHVTTGVSQGIAIAKVYEAVLVVVPILVLTKLSGADLGSIYLKRGNLKLGLSIGALVGLNFAASAFLFFATRYTSMENLSAAIVWGLAFSLANGFMEELWLRGIFLKRFEPVLGIGGSVLVSSIIFALWHGGATYLTPIAIPFMVVNTFTLGLACGYLIMKTDSIWGAVLIHAASDLFLFLAILANA
ncbi:MAG: CPBP family intramembrane metalloprotease [Chloroflexi bacterium]|nr:CPBP family intramembrane metalloprotease [Chloroflexota bacterium]